MLSRIGYVVNSFPKLSETFIAEEINELQSRGIQVKLLSLNRPSEEVQHSIITGGRLQDLVVHNEREFAQWADRHRPDLIHAHFATQPTECARRLSLELDVPYSFTAHGYDVYRKAPTDLADRAISAMAVVTVSDANKSFLVEEYSIPGDHIHVIPCGINTEKFCPTDNRKDIAHIVCVARLAPVKNLGMLVEACRVLRDRNVDFRCSIVGEGRARESLTCQIEQHGLGNHVDLVGAKKQDEVVKYWQSADVGVLCSLSEGMPVCLMEAASCGVSVVAREVGGVSELVQQRVTGLTVASEDTAAFANAIETLLKNDGLCAAMSRNARREAVARFSVKKQVDSLLQIWETAAVTCEHGNS
ncbi:MAG: glycosyltransferase family 4 protein [Planctomycetales bacterium]|nr:glycosyltransferase family 4 protein [Planctomycetales bacterium]